MAGMIGMFAFPSFASSNFKYQDPVVSYINMLNKKRTEQMSHPITKAEIKDEDMFQRARRIQLEELNRKR